MTYLTPRPFGVDYRLPRSTRVRHTVVMAPDDVAARMHVNTVHPGCVILAVAALTSKPQR